MNADTTNTDLIRGYLLDALTDNERSAVEERFLADDMAFDEMLACEDELFYEYQQDELNASERQVFEQKFLRTREDRERAVFAGAFIEASADLSQERAFVAVPIEEEGSSLLKSIAAFFNFSSALQFGMAAAGLVIALGVVGLLVQKSWKDSEIAAIQQQQSEAERRDREAEIVAKQKEQQEVDNRLAAEREKAATDENRIKELETERQKLEAEINERQRRVDPSPKAERPGGQSSIATLIISPGRLTRSDGLPMNRVVLESTIRSLNLRLTLKNVDEYKAFGLTVRSVDDYKTILTRSGLAASGKGARRGITISIPARSLQRADYEVSLKGVGNNGETEEITTYYFSVDKR